MSEPRILEEVQDYLSVNRQLYVVCMEDLTRILDQIRYHPEWANVIYRIYSRADKQLGDPFKSPRKIAEKLADWRKKQPGAPASAIHDIIGLTIVVTYPSDLDLLTGYLVKPGSLPGFKTGTPTRKESGGYHAVHLVVTSVKPASQHIRHELQIKTMLHDGWSAKTHDLTYKPGGEPGGEVDDTLGQHMSVLGDVLRLLDDQSELIKALITEKWNMDKTRKGVARRQLLIQLMKGQADLPYHDAITQWGNKIEGNVEYFKNAKDSDNEYQEFFNAVCRIKEEHGYNLSLCRLITLLASVRESGDLNGYTLTEIDNWQAGASDEIERCDAYTLRALANFAFGKFADAVTSGEQALAYGSEHGLASVPRVKGVLSYLIAEAHYHHKQKFGSDYVAKARTLIAEAITASGDEPPYVDTKGAIEIVCGETETKVREGLAFCTRALEAVSIEDSRRPVAEAFYRLHERRAFRRLLAWE